MPEFAADSLSFSPLDPSVWVSLVTLSLMEIVLGIDNVIFISLVVARLPAGHRARARQLGLFLALAMRIALLLTITWIIGLKHPVLKIFGQQLSWRDFILLAGGLFLLVKATHEIHGTLEVGRDHDGLGARAAGTFAMAIAQIGVIDLVFSVDSIITAVGMADHVEIMIAAVLVAMAVMYVASDAVSGFIEQHPSTKILALAFLMMVGVALVADGLQFHIPRGYIYFSLAFAAVIEMLNIHYRKQRRQPRAAKEVAEAPRRAEAAAAPAAGEAQSAIAVGRPQPGKPGKRSGRRKRRHR